MNIRMHIKPTGVVRNHGTGFRIAENHLKNLYSKHHKLI